MHYNTGDPRATSVLVWGTRAGCATRESGICYGSTASTKDWGEWIFLPVL